MVNHKKIGRYEITSVMGQGAMGTVYKAVDPVIERIVAIKTINLQLSKEERAEFEERFFREAKSAGRLNHPNIVTIYDVGETEEAAYIAMEYIEGETLRDVLDSGVVLPPKRICSIVAHVAMALNYAHENGVVHRDIKPANIMITRNRDVKIMDFGIASIPTGSRTQAGTVLGSPKYMAPEQVAGKAVDGRADIFSLGAMLYEMLTGTTPFNGDNLSAIMYKILNEEPILPSVLNARVPVEFDTIVSKALAKRPEDRYQTAKEIARELRKYEIRVSRDTQKPDAASPAAIPPQQSPASHTDQNAVPDDDPLDVKTDLLPPRSSHSNTMAEQSSRPTGGSKRNLLLLAIPVLIFVALAISQLPGKIHAPALPDQLAQAPGDENASKQTKTPTKQTGKESPQASSKAKVSSSATHSSTSSQSAGSSANATASLAITPWGEVYVDGKKAGISPPLNRLALSPGTHDIEIRNGTFAPYRVKVNVTADQSLKIKHKFK